VRERARLQGIPDWVVFCGSLKEQMRQVGNAVAPPVARAYGIAFLAAVHAPATLCCEMTVPPWYVFAKKIKK
jgi:hypothetical protein